jgi:uncharacterized protein YycO
MSRLLYAIWSKLLTAFGDVKVFKFPMFFVFDPDDFQITGEKTLEIMDILEPGDIILRGYNRYLDGKFIPDPLKFSHGALYIGNNRIIHAVAEGVSETNTVEFTRCDRIAIFRPKKGQRKAISTAKKFLKDAVPYDFGFSKGVSAIYCFELCGECYDKLDIPRKTVSKFFGLIKKENVFLAESFFESPDMECVFQFNPKFNINFRK